MSEVDRSRRARERGDGRTWRERALDAEARSKVLSEALERISKRDAVDEWITGDECAEIARAALGGE